MLTVLGTIAIVLVTIVAGVAADRRWGLLPRKERLLAAGRPGLRLPAHAPGDAPATALALAPAALAKLRRRRRRCPACRGRTTALPDDHVTYDGQPLVVVHSRCTRCGRTHATYVDAR